MDNNFNLDNVDFSKMIKNPDVPADYTITIPVDKELERLQQKIIQSSIEANQRKRQAEISIIEQNEVTKQILAETKDVNSYLIQANCALEEINDNLRKQLQAINSNIDFLINTIGGNTQISEEQQAENRKLLIEIQLLLKTKDKAGLREFIGRHTGDGIALVGLVLQGLSMLS